MDNILVDDVQDADKEASQVIAGCLGNSIIVRKIMDNFSTLELLKLSFVNKMWNREARTEMRKRGDLTARLKCTGVHPCQQDLEAFAMDLQQMNVVPFSGIILIICHGQRVGPCPTGNVDPDPTNDIILDRLPLKQVVVQLAAKWWEHQNCPGFLLTKKCLQDCSGVIEELVLKVHARREQFIDQVVQESRFGRLKVLQLLENKKMIDEGYTNYMKALVSRAPELQELHIQGPTNLMKNVMEGSSAVIFYQSPVDASFDRIPESVIHALRLRRMLLFRTGPEFNFERFNRIFPMLLNTCCSTTLRVLAVDAILALPLMCSGVCLKNVTRLQMLIYYNILRSMEPRILGIVKNFDFTQTFPNLKKVRISGLRLNNLSHDHMNGFIEQAEAVLKEPSSDRADNIKELELKGFLSSLMVQFYAEMFPNIEKLVLSDHYCPQDIPFGCIWERWVHLKEIEVTTRYLSAGNFDSAFCGIFPEEVAELREKDDEFLKKVNIVPVMPAITCLKNLKTLTIYYGRVRNHPVIYDPLFIFTKVTGLIAFARMPKLHVNLQTDSDEILEAMRHVKPFASVVLKKRNLDGWGL